MQAVILAAGMGKRLKDLTKDNTKCMVKVNGVTLIDRMLHQIDNKKLDRIVIVVGYKGDKLKEYISTLDITTPIVYIENSVYDKTNNIYSLYLAKDYLLQDDTLLFESDIIFEDTVLDELINDPRETLALVDKYESWMDGTCVKISENDDIEAFVPGKKFKFDEISEYYKTVNIYKFSKHFSLTHYVPFLEAYSKALGNNEYYEQVLRVITMLDDPEIKAKKLSGQLWYEIDDIQDLDIASSMFMDDEYEKLSLVQGRYGGYWRYPKLLDFCYLVNPYYPNERLLNEIKSNFDKLITQYPSGMRVNSLLASKNFGVEQDYIVVGNGAAELIKSLVSYLSLENKKVGIIRPTFEEYPNRYDKSKEIIFVPDNSNFSYDENDLINYFNTKDVSSIILINPDNPSGNYIRKAGLLKLIEWTKENNIKLVIDESFVDFSDEKDSTLLDNSILGNNPHLVVVKSISKSYGVPGLRLGVLASGNKELIDYIKKDVSIWNINSFAEFYMQIAEKYKSDYEVSLEELRKERTRFSLELSKINGITVIPSQANYIMIRVDGIFAKELTKILLIKYNLFVKDLSSKIKTGDGLEYIRIAVRDRNENNLLIKSLREIMIRLGNIV